MALTTDVNETDYKLNQMTIGDANDDEDDDNEVRQANLGKKGKTGNDSKDVNNVTDKASEMEKKQVASDYSFDIVVGYIEDMLIDEGFHDLQKSFLEKYWKEFDDSEENKLCYITIFMEYTNKIEEFIETYLSKLIPGFAMDEFITELEQRKNELEGEVFEVLFTLTDFEVFKEMFLDYRLMKEGNAVDFGQSLFVSSIP